MKALIGHNNIIQRKIESIKFHSDFDKTRTKRSTDIALLSMNEWVEFNSMIQPISLPHPDEKTLGKTGKFVGFSSSNQLVNSRQVHAKINNFAGCALNDPQAFDHALEESFCAVGRQISNCSGKTLKYFKNYQKNNTFSFADDHKGSFFIQKDKNWRLLGVSHGNRSNCNDSNVAVFLDMKRFVDWITCESKCGINSKCVMINSEIKCRCKIGYTLNANNNCEPG